MSQYINKVVSENDINLKIKKITNNFLYEKSQFFPINTSLNKGDYLTVYKKDYISYNNELSKVITKEYQDIYTAKLSKPKYIPKS
jgi:hypothetical protein